MNDEVLKQTTALVSVYITHNEIDIGGIPDLIRTIYGTMSTLDAPSAPVIQQDPAVPIKKSVFPDHIVCLECGKKLKTLKRHLAAEHSLTIPEYISRWSLPSNYPTVAPEYAAKRSAMAVQIGLGRKAA